MKQKEWKYFMPLFRGLRPLLALFALLTAAGIRPARAADERPGAGGFDSSLWFGTRSVPLAAALAAQGGYSRVLWGDPSKGPLGYGFVRAGGRVQSSAVVSMAEGTLGIYPVSFAGVNFGAGSSLRLIPFTRLVSCEVYDCIGTVNNAYVQPRIALKAGPFAGVFNYRLQRLVPRDSSRPFFDERSALAGGAGGDTTEDVEAFFGVELGEQRQAGLLYLGVRFMESSRSSQLLSAVYRFRAGEARDWSVALGLGGYRSSFIPATPAALAVVQWTLDPGLLIF